MPQEIEPPTLVSCEIAVGDFNHDGNLDIVVTSQDDNTVLVLLNNSGDGTFQDGYVKYAVGAFPNAVAVGGFTNDGNLDIVTASANNKTDSVTVLLGNGDGTFQEPPKTYTLDHESFAVAVGDFNHDGNLDIVTVNYYANSVAVLLGNGDGTFQQPPHYSPVGGGGGPVAIAIGDFTNNRNLDIVTANYNPGTVWVMLGNGDGTFQAPPHYYWGSLDYRGQNIR